MVVVMWIPNLLLTGVLAMSLPVQIEAVAPTDAHSVPADTTWLLAYQGKSTGSVRWDKRFPALLRNGLPHYRVEWWENSTLPAAAFTLLSGPTDMVRVESNRYVTLSAAVEHDAQTKGLLWVDTGASQPKMIFAYLLQDQFKLERASLTLYTKNSDLAITLPDRKSVV